MVGQLAAAEQAASATAAKGKLGLYRAAKDAKNETPEAPTRGQGEDGQKSRIPGVVKAGLPIMIIFGAIFAIVGIIVALPIMMIGAIDYNLQKALGFTETVGVLETQGAYVTAEMAMNGEVPSKYASDLAEHGVDVGQITASGDFYETNVYIANIEEKDGFVAAAGGFSYVSDEEGELAMLYDGKIIRASEFVAAVNSDPKLYAAYSGAADLSAKYYYGNDISDAYESMGLSRGNFNNWVQTGDYATDEANFKSILDGVLDNETTAVVGGARDDAEPRFSESTYRVISSWWTKIFSKGNDDDKDTGNFEENISTGDASTITSTVADKTKAYIFDWDKSDECEGEDEKGNKYTYKCQFGLYDETQTKRAAELLNSAVSAKEPYTAANTFLAIEEPIQRARAGDNGPVNELMNVISKPTAVSYENVYTGEMETQSLSILETVNFQAAVGEQNYSKDEAANFARDRILYRTEQTDTEIINTTVVTSNGGKKAESAVRNGKGESANADIISKANNSVDLAISQTNSSLFQSVIGGNRLLEGGSFLNNNLNRKVIGSMPSDAEAIAKYDVVVEEALARMEEADRVTRSPFDISSPNTFLGSIAHNLATAVMGSYNSKGMSIVSAMQATGEVAGTAVAGIFDSASAEGTRQKFTTLNQDNCATIGTVSVEGDLYCSSHNTVSTDYIHYTLDDWKNSDIGDSIDDEGKIVEESEMDKFVIMGMDREATVGVSSAEVCEASGNLSGGILDKILHFFADVVGLYKTCKSVDTEVATGANYTFTEHKDENLDLYSGYALYNEVYSLLSETDSATALARERYYAKYPKDNSEAGVIARISGMTKAEATIALAYGEYLNEIANYDASNRYHFGVEDFGLEDDGFNLKNHSDKMAGDYVAWYMKETEYKDLRELTTCA